MGGIRHDRVHAVAARISRHGRVHWQVVHSGRDGASGRVVPGHHARRRQYDLRRLLLARHHGDVHEAACFRIRTRGRADPRCRKGGRGGYGLAPPTVRRVAESSDGRGPGGESALAPIGDAAITHAVGRVVFDSVPFHCQGN